jgi:hypothetical protein
MNVEKTMEFILQQQANAEGQMAAIRQQQARAEVEMAAIRRQQAKAEVQMAAIRKLIQTGMKILVKQGEHVNELAKSQRLTETKLQGLIDALRQRGNGSRSRN